MDWDARLGAVEGALMARVHRFVRAKGLVQSGMALALVAGRCGYADQAHLTREWRVLAGQTPACWEAFPILQDD